MRINFIPMLLTVNSPQPARDSSGLPDRDLLQDDVALWGTCRNYQFPCEFNPFNRFYLPSDSKLDYACQFVINSLVAMHWKDVVCVAAYSIPSWIKYS